MHSGEDTAFVKQNPDSPSPTSPMDSPNEGVGLSDPQFSSGRRRMLDLVNRLHSTGVQVDIDLPQIAVIGNQSAGKSSLIESISGITLPRAAGTCTRCPTECRLSRSTTPWQCIVALRFITDAHGQPLGQATNKQFGDIIYDKSEVEERIRRAQLAILNPNQPAKSFLDGSDDSTSETQLSFSNNCVTLQISGPDVADLSFCDLPGLIASQSSSRGGNNDITLVQNLVTSYIKKTSCIILLTVACETDFENQGAHRLAKDFDPDGKRTIGVLTKPDRIPIGEEASWLPFIRNEKESLENGWFCVKQPSSNELKQGLTWDDARAMENQYFSSTAHWAELEGIYQCYLRTSNLVKRLSAVLSDLIAKRLPQIQEELERSILQAHNQLSGLPREPSSDPRSEISSFLHIFTIDVSKHVEGVSDDAKGTSDEENGTGLIQDIRPAQDTFRKSIRATAPNFRPFESTQKVSEVSHPAFLESEEDAEGLASQINGEPIYINEVLQKAQQARTRELPGHFPFIVQKKFIEEIIKKWRTPAMIMCKAVHAVIAEHIRALISRHFAEFGQGMLEHRVTYIMHQHLKQCLERAQERVEWPLELEAAPFSLNTHYLSEYRDKFFNHYRGIRHLAEGHDLLEHIEYFQEDSSPCEGSPYGVAKVLASLNEIGLHSVKPEDLTKLLPADPMEPALAIMADVRAYFQVAYKRFSDNIPLAIDHEIVRGAERRLLQILYNQLGINKVDGQRICSELAQESPQIAAKRTELKKKLERLENASGELLTLGG